MRFCWEILWQFAEEKWFLSDQDSEPCSANRAFVGKLSNFSRGFLGIEFHNLVGAFVENGAVEELEIKETIEIFGQILPGKMKTVLPTEISLDDEQPKSAIEFPRTPAKAATSSTLVQQVGGAILEGISALKLPNLPKYAELLLDEEKPKTTMSIYQP